MTTLRILLAALAALLALLILGVVPALAAAPPETPEVSVESIRATEATINGIVSPAHEAEPGLYEFLYRASSTRTCRVGSRAPATPGMYFGGEHEPLPTETLTGLTPDTEYAVCLRVESEGGEAVSAPITFTTLQASAPAIESEAVSSESKNSVVISATIDANGAATSCEVKYGVTESLEDSTACPAELTARSVGQPVEIALTGLQPATEYHYELVAVNEKGTVTGTPGVFTSHPSISAVTDAATSVKRATAILNGSINPEGTPTEYYFEYGPEACDPGAGTCGAKTPVRGPITEEETVEPLKLSRLEAGTTYHYWLVASGPGVTAHGEEETFTTASTEPKEYVEDGRLSVGSPKGVGVNEVTGDVYATDTAAHTIEHFNAAGVLVSSIKMPEGAGATWQLAVDNSGIRGEQGDVYVADTNAGVVYKFDASETGELKSDATTPTIPAQGEPALQEPRGVAVDASGDVYIASGETVSKYSPTGTPIAPAMITGLPTVIDLALDASGNIYVADLASTVEYDPAGVCVNACAPISEGFSEGVAVDSAGNVFVSVLRPAVVREYGPGEGHPLIANPVLERAGTFGQFPLGLAVNSTTHELYVAENGGALRLFKFFTAVPVIVRTEPATQIAGAVESLNGTVNPGGNEPAEYYFEYGTSPCGPETCGAVATEPSQVPLNGDEAIPVSVRLDNLPPNTTFHYRIVGVNEESGVEYGEEQTFTTGSETGPPPAGDQSEHKTPLGEEPPAAAAYPNLTGLAPVPMPKAVTPVTLAQKLQKALRACHKDRNARKRKSCEAAARRAFGPKKKTKKKATKTPSKGVVRAFQLAAERARARQSK